MSHQACLFGTYAREHSANRLLRATLAAAGSEVRECHVPLWERTRDKLPGFFRPVSLLGHVLDYARALPSLIARWRTVARDVRLLVIGFNGQLDLLVARRLARGRVPILFSPLVTVSETLVDDRRVYAPGSLGARLLHWIDRATLGGADLVLADTEAHRTYMCDTFSIMPAKVRTMYLGAEELFFRKTRRECGQVRSVLFYGQYVPLHGVETIIEAARELAGRFEIVLVGTGPERRKMETLAQGVPNLRFVDWVAYEELPGWIGAADICLGIFGNSRKAAMVIPNKVYQAAAGGCPVVTSDTPAVREVFNHGRDVWLVPPADGRRLASAIRGLAGDEPTRGLLGGGARTLMETRFRIEKRAERLRDLLAETLGLGGVHL